MPGIKIDGNNVIEVFRTARRAIEGARQGKGPTLIECMTYRWRGHVGTNLDLDKGLRSKEELDYWMNKCPIETLERSLSRHNILSESERSQIHRSIEEEIKEAIAFAKENQHREAGHVCVKTARLTEGVNKVHFLHQAARQFVLARSYGNALTLLEEAIEEEGNASLWQQIDSLVRKFGFRLKDPTDQARGWALRRRLSGLL